MKSDQEDIQTMGSKSSSTSRKSKEGKCILIYEDSQEILFLCKMILSKMNYRIETMSKCDNVIKDIAVFKPDFILMDLWIPKIGGEKAVVLIKENPATRHIPVFLFSANDKIEEICKKSKADGYIKKPFDVVAFKETIAQNI